MPFFFRNPQARGNTVVPLVTCTPTRCRIPFKAQHTFMNLTMQQQRTQKLQSALVRRKKQENQFFVRVSQWPVMSNRTQTDRDSFLRDPYVSVGTKSVESTACKNNNTTIQIQLLFTLRFTQCLPLYAGPYSKYGPAYKGKHCKCNTSNVRV